MRPFVGIERDWKKPKLQFTTISQITDYRTLVIIHKLIKKICSRSAIIEKKKTCNECIYFGPGYSTYDSNCQYADQHELIIKIRGNHKEKVERVLTHMGLFEDQNEEAKKRIDKWTTEIRELRLKIQIEKEKLLIKNFSIVSSIN